ncbi:EAL domain-containing protein [Alteromonas sp. 1_MG-2023]|uniref:EAL domain-containing protein n=1 Tax=Alteromonas sp. 1_MG-2023 TaxID=3062669 RepID=UPI0026E4595C|nr:EAL domain-containing protein [Alteromonas sp. 1_MG-2023]MDO6567368.1 EAL domain-containing protein [Alteromonas sp. 1_MG-2023]
MKSLRSDIALTTIASVAIISVLIMALSIRVYEELYQDFVAFEFDALAENMAVDLLPVINNSAGSFSQTQVLLRLDEYEYVDFARVYNEYGELVNLYIGNANINGDTSQTSSITDTEYQTLDSGFQTDDGSIFVIKIIGEADFPMGKLVLSYDIQKPLAENRWEFISLVTPVVLLLLLSTVFITLRLQKRLLIPLTSLIAKMKKVEREANYDVKVSEAGKFEIASLGRGFNSMMRHIKQQTDINQRKTLLLERQQSQMEKLANFDTLTGLPNRQFLMKSLSIELARAKRDKSEVALMFLDLDGFKQVNDSFGHDAGDKLLCGISTEISYAMREGDIVGRLGGDEFLIILVGNPTQSQLQTIARRLITTITQLHHIDGWRVDPSVSIGIALATDCDYAASSLVTNADVAMYEAKKEGKGRYVWFTSSMQEATRRKNQVATFLPHAIENSDFHLVYQAKVNEFGEVVGFETLLRWYDEELGNISPAEFIPIAEQSDKISEITLWVINQACIEIPRITAQYGEKIRISINLSAYDLINVHVTDSILNGLRSGKIPKDNVEFEITESAYMNNFSIANTFLSDLKNEGCKISLDDFGTGYSSLSYITEFNIDTLKIDRQFVSQIGLSKRSELITITIIEMAKNLNLEVCAEGIETHEQSAFLTDNGCHILQGFLYSKPIPLDALLSQQEEQALLRLAN